MGRSASWEQSPGEFFRYWGEYQTLTSETKQNNPSVSINLNSPPNLHSAQSFANIANVPNGLFSNGGSTTWAVIRATVNPRIAKAWPQFQIRYTDPPTGSPGSSQGIKMLLQDQLSFAQFSRSLTIEEYLTEGLRNVARNRGGIDYASASAVVPRCTVKAIPLGRTLTSLVSAYKEPITPRSQCPTQRNRVNQQILKRGNIPLHGVYSLLLKKMGNWMNKQETPMLTFS